MQRKRTPSAHFDDCDPFLTPAGGIGPSDTHTSSFNSNGTMPGVLPLHSMMGRYAELAARAKDGPIATMEDRQVNVYLRPPHRACACGSDATSEGSKKVAGR